MSVDINRGQRRMLALVTAHVLDDAEAAEVAERDIDLNDVEACAELVYAAVDLLAQAIVVQSLAGGYEPEVFLGRLGSLLAVGAAP